MLYGGEYGTPTPGPNTHNRTNRGLPYGGKEDPHLRHTLSSPLQPGPIQMRTRNNTSGPQHLGNQQPKGNWAFYSDPSARSCRRKHSGHGHHGGTPYTSTPSIRRIKQQLAGLDGKQQGKGPCITREHTTLPERRRHIPGEACLQCANGPQPHQKQTVQQISTTDGGAQPGISKKQRQSQRRINIRCQQL